MVLHNTAPITHKATLHYKSLCHKELKEVEWTQKSIKVWRRVPFPLKGLVLIQTLTNAGTIRLPRRGYFLFSLELVCLESDFPILDCNKRTRMFFYLENNPIHPSALGSWSLPNSAPASQEQPWLSSGPASGLWVRPNLRRKAPTTSTCSHQEQGRHRENQRNVWPTGSVR